MPSLIVPIGTATPCFAPIEQEIERYDLAEHLAELDEQGLCIVPLGKLQVGSNFVDRAREALLHIARHRLETPFKSVEAPAPNVPKGQGMGQFILSHLLLEGDIFEEIYVNPVRKTVMRHLLGDVHRMSTSNGWVKIKTPAAHEGPLTTMLHADTVGPTPWPATEPHVANMNWLLTDYSRRDGALAYVPGSHRRGAQPGPRDGLVEAVPVEAPAGSLVFFHGATWHGAFRKETEGLRLSIHGLCCRPYYLPQQDYRGCVSSAVLERSADPEYLKMLIGEGDPWLKRTPYVQ